MTDNGNSSFQYVAPAAWRIVQRAATAYAKLQSYTGTLEKHTIAPKDKEWGMSPQRAIIAYKRPNQCSVVIQNDSGIWSSVSDGDDVYSTVPRSNKVLKTSVPVGIRLWSGAFGVGRDALMTLGTGYFATLASSTSDRQLRISLLDQVFLPEEKLQATTTLDTLQSVNGEAVDTVVLWSRHFSRQSGEIKARWRTSRRTLAFAKSDGLLRRVTLEFERLPREKPFITVETHCVTSLNGPLPDEMFCFTPPGDDVQEVGSVRELYPQQEPMFDPRLNAGAEPFAFTATDLDRRTFSLDDYKY